MIVELIVLTDYESLLIEYDSHATRTRWGVICNPVNIGGKWCLPLGWELELDAANIDYTIEQIELVEYAL